MFLQHPTLPAGDTSQPPCPVCTSFATLTRTHSDSTVPFWWGKFAPAGARERMNFPILIKERSFDDGQREHHVVLNWFEELKRLVP